MGWSGTPLGWFWPRGALPPPCQLAYGRPVADPIPDGEHLPATSRLWPDTVSGPWLLTFHWQVLSGRAECVALDIASALPSGVLAERFEGLAKLPEVGQPVTTSLLRSLPLAQLVLEEREKADELFATKLGDRELGATYKGPARMRATTERRLRKTAEVYRGAWRRGDAPVKAVAKQLKVTDAAATKLVSRARSAGFLPPTKPGAPMG